MKLESQVTSLELSKRLKELGVKQDSLFWWHPIPNVLSKENETSVIGVGYDISYADTGRFFGSKARISAFTVAELGEMLLRCGITSNTKLYSYGRGWIELESIDGDVIMPAPERFGDNENTEVDARAAMLIYLLENNLVGEK